MGFFLFNNKGYGLPVCRSVKFSYTLINPPFFSATQHHLQTSIIKNGASSNTKPKKKFNHEHDTFNIMTSLICKLRSRTSVSCIVVMVVPITYPHTLCE